MIIQSLHCQLYQLLVECDGEEQPVYDRKGRLVRHSNRLGLQALFENLEVEELVLRQLSAYDEMVGQPPREGDNCLEIPLGKTDMAIAPRGLLRQLGGKR